MPKGGTPANLKPFKKGEDPRRNIKGAPKKLPLLELIMAEEMTPEKIRTMINAMQKQVDKGNVSAFNSLMDRGYGRVKQPVDITLQMPDLDNLEIKFK